MYTDHFNLTILPFENVPDPIFFFDKDDYARARKRLTESLKSGRGLLVVTGTIGSGKTTLSQMIKSDFSRDNKLIWMAAPPGNSTDLFLFIAQELGLNPSTSERTFVIRDIRNALLEINSEGRKCLVIIDESHLMSDDIVNSIRLLNNLEEGPVKLIQILLLGQDELMGIINRPEMEPFRQRIATLEILGKMNSGRIRDYISHRIHIAGGRLSIFADSAWEALVLPFRSGGTPRIINSLCDRSLNLAFEREKTSADAHDVLDAAQGMGIGKEIFHYAMDLRHRERMEQAPVDTVNISSREPATDSKIPLYSPAKESDETDIVQTNLLTEFSQSNKKDSKADLLISRINQEGLRIPLLMLLLSLATLILSISFHCQRSGSEPINCLYKLIGF